jgi:phage shock protein A
MEMMKKEFEKRIGLVITAGEYAAIEAAYMWLPESVNKDKFVKIWLREGGIQDLFDKRLADTKRLQESVEELKAENSQVWEDAGKERQTSMALKKELQTLKDKLAAICATAMETVAQE